MEMGKCTHWELRGNGVWLPQPHLPPPSILPLFRLLVPVAAAVHRCQFIGTSVQNSLGFGPPVLEPHFDLRGRSAANSILAFLIAKW